MRFQAVANLAHRLFARKCIYSRFIHVTCERTAKITKAPDVSPEPPTYSRIGSRLFDSGEGFLLTSTDGLTVPLGSPTCDCIVNMARSRLYVRRASFFKRSVCMVSP